MNMWPQSTSIYMMQFSKHLKGSLWINTVRQCLKNMFCHSMPSLFILKYTVGSSSLTIYSSSLTLENNPGYPGKNMSLSFFLLRMKVKQLHEFNISQELMSEGLLKVHTSARAKYSILLQKPTSGSLQQQPIRTLHALSSRVSNYQPLNTLSRSLSLETLSLIYLSYCQLCEEDCLREGRESSWHILSQKYCFWRDGSPWQIEQTMLMQLKMFWLEQVSTRRCYHSSVVRIFLGMLVELMMILFLIVEMWVTGGTSHVRASITSKSPELSFLWVLPCLCSGSESSSCSIRCNIFNLHDPSQVQGE